MKKLLIISMVFWLCVFISSCKQEQVSLKAGDRAPDFSLIDRQGKAWTLSELRGQVVFINFWATWCPPCLKELPSMQTLYTTLPGENFKMLAVLSKDLPYLADHVAKQKGITIPILDDAENIVGSDYRLTGLPETYIVDKQGIIREKIIGAAQWDSPDYVQLIMRYIDQ